MEKLTNENDIISLINDNKIAIVYFTGRDCGACEVIKYKVECILDKLPKIKSGEINGEEKVELAVKYGVFSLPICLLFIEGKEALRVGRNVDLLEFERNINRYYELIY